MKKNLRQLWLASAGAVFALAISSCAYDPYYSSTSVGGSYSSGYGGYGDGYGYGGSSFTTSIFVSTGDPRWGYDPYCHSYYDYNRRCYYDPYLNGYYPIGYRPAILVGVPHPYGWRSGYCPPPRNYRNVNISHYRERENNYRKSNYGWAKQVHQQPNRPSGNRPSGNHGPGGSNRPSQGNGYRPENHSRPATNSRPNSGSRPSAAPFFPSRESTRPDATRQRTNQPPTRNPQRGGLPSSYNTPINSRQPQQSPRGALNFEQRSQPSRQSPASAYQGGGQRQAPSRQTESRQAPSRQPESRQAPSRQSESRSSNSSKEDRGRPAR